MANSFTGKVFYLDISHPGVQQKIKKQLKLMDVQINTILNRSVNYLITDQPQSIISSTHQTNSQSAQKQLSKSPFSLPVLFSQKKFNINKARKFGSRIVSVRCIQKWLNYHKSQRNKNYKNNKLVREKERTANQTRRNAFNSLSNKPTPLLSKTKLLNGKRSTNTKTQKKTNILQNANNISVLRKIKMNTTNVNNNQNNLNTQKKKLSIINKNYNYLQIEDMQSDYRPTKKRFPQNKMRTTSFFLQQRSSRRLYNLSQVTGERGQEWKSRQKRRLQHKKRRRKIKGSGYCENCKVKYSNFENHCQSKEHQRFCKNSKYFEKVDSFIEKIENMFQQEKNEKNLIIENLQKTDREKKKEKDNNKDFMSSSLSLECEEIPHSKDMNFDFNHPTTMINNDLNININNNTNTNSIININCKNFNTTTTAAATATTTTFLTLTDRVDEWYSPNYQNHIDPLVNEIEITKKKIEPIILFDDSLNWNDQGMLENSDDDFATGFQPKNNRKRKKQK
ncbi:activator of s-phase kinase-related [Anaeramoeba flamelloides]|uniref:Activator of s-phase kinase-related n=1 Tax=Anaeramoeba flamelloides TaxID=1746091 RepID=A0ABQ8X3J3_9EUKA|nr:activator of s-phase kinase-related [Anaeramoeba flamelloides]